VILSHTKEKQRGNTTRAGMDEAGGVADLERASRFSTEGRNGSCSEQALLDLRDCHRMMIAVGGAWADEAACWIAYWGRMQWGRGGVDHHLCFLLFSHPDQIPLRFGKKRERRNMLRENRSSARGVDAHLLFVGGGSFFK
jgi:hypothetical protein